MENFKIPCWIFNFNFICFFFFFVNEITEFQQVFIYLWNNACFLSKTSTFSLQYIQHPDVYKGCRSYRLFSQVRQTYGASFMNVVLKHPPWLHGRVAFTVQHYLLEINIKFTLQQAMNLGAGWGWLGKAASLQLYLRKEPVPILDEVRWVPGQVLTVEQNLAPTEIQSPDRSGRSGRCTDYAVIDRISDTTDSFSLEG
jgi:hypothetical protein